VEGGFVFIQHEKKQLERCLRLEFSLVRITRGVSTQRCCSYSSQPALFPHGRLSEQVVGAISICSAGSLAASNITVARRK